MLKRSVSISKVIIITGSSGGVGSELARKYLADDYVIFGLDVTKKEFHSENYFHIDCNLLDFSKDINYRTSLLNNINKNFQKI